MTARKHHLEKIKPMYGFIECDEFTIKTKDFDWLVSRAEQMEDLEKSLAFMEKQRIEMGNSHQETIKGAGFLLDVNQRYKQALEFYANPSTYEVYKTPNTFIIPIENDCGEKAIQALEGTKTIND